MSISIARRIKASLNAPPKNVRKKGRNFLVLSGSGRLNIDLIEKSLLYLYVILTVIGGKKIQILHANYLPFQYNKLSYFQLLNYR
jgi:hypothetical protein